MIGDFIKREVVTVTPGMTVREAANLVIEKRIGTLPVVNDAGKLLGVVRLEDLVAVFMPDFVSLLEDIDFVHDYGVLETLTPQDVLEEENLTMSRLMQPPVAVEEGCGALRAFATLGKHRLRDLPVVNSQGQLVGIASHVDIAVAFLSGWVERQEPT